MFWRACASARPLTRPPVRSDYVLVGAAGSDYEGGVYHGKVVFPPQYPYKPPSILMLTPSGRFAVNQRLCLSMSDYRACARWAWSERLSCLNV